ncbi:uncharacterized protein TNIN_327031 [Trichonephila inaurata madagascariensis]|uniref:Uncharacterized protein n=1 Tax=Trichonephila inaurata madagascariensis TaxID=2747483 RepID=A0A8X6Y361_9ARAC|nr:uncharacterized protein TNIN_327031 [Trichonephila inaurata madagascariensis]
MAINAIVLAAMMMTTVLPGSDSSAIQARGMDEGPWSMMNQEPEVLIVKEKGGGMSNGGNMGMSMKDLTPIICLLAPLLLAAIMIPAKMTMMMNGMMGNMGNMGGMIPMVLPMLPNGMLPGIGGMLPGIGGMLPGIGGMLPMPGGGILPTGKNFQALLTSGFDGTQLPISKKENSSKEFSGKEFSDEYRNRLNQTFDDEDGNDIESSCKGKDCKKGDLSSFLSGKEWLKKRKMQTSEDTTREETKEWSSRVWSEKAYKTTIANQILNLLNEIEKAIQHYELQN